MVIAFPDRPDALVLMKPFRIRSTGTTVNSRDIHDPTPNTKVPDYCESVLLSALDNPKDIRTYEATSARAIGTQTQP